MRSVLFTITLALMMAGSAVGQIYTTKSPEAVEKNAFTAMLAPGLSMTGVQNAPGSYDQNNDKCWGNMFVLRGSGEWFTAQLAITMDYAAGLPDLKEGNYITGGHWSLTIYKDGEYYATYFGNIVEGNITWSLNPKSGMLDKRETIAVLRPTGSIDGNYIDKLPLLHFTADTRLDGNVAFTNAVMDLEF